MFADTLFAAERLHLVRLLIWGAISIVAGTILLLLTSSSRLRPQLLRSFASQCMLWGALELALAAIGFATLRMRDLSGASRLERLGWMQLGIYIGLAACGITSRRRDGAPPDRSERRAPVWESFCRASHFS